MELREAVAAIKGSRSKSEALERAYTLLCSRYHGERVKTYTFFWRLFENNVSTLWNRTGFLHCTKLNQLLRYLLIESGWFTAADIELRWSMVWFISPHQYARIKIADAQYRTIDIWGASYGIAFGDYAHGLH